MTIPSTFSDVLIEGNTIGVGSSQAGGVPTFYGYGASATSQDGYIIYTNADCRILNNYISGAVTTASTYMMGLTSCSCLVQGNTFVRESAAITAYVISSGPDDHTIIDNIFDGYTVDGSTFQDVSPLVTGLSATSRYTNNKNQVAWAIIPLGPTKDAIYDVQNGSFTIFGVYNSSNFSSIGSSFGVTSGGFYDDYVLRLFDATASPGQNFFSMGIDVTPHVPIGAKIIDAKISIYNPSSITLNTGGTNQFNLGLSAGRGHLQAIDVKTYQSGGTLSQQLGFNVVGTLSINAGNEPNLRSAYQVIEIPTLNYTGFQTTSNGTTTSVANADVSSNFVSSNDYGLTAKLIFFYEASSQGTDVLPIIVVSPLIISYLF